MKPVVTFENHNLQTLEDIIYQHHKKIPDFGKQYFFHKLLYVDTRFVATFVHKLYAK